MIVGQVVQWILTNRKGKAFENYDVNKIATELLDCLDTGGLLVVSDNDSIVGVVCSKPDVEKKILYVHDILVTKTGVLKRMLQYCKKQFPNYIVQGKKKTGKLRQFNDIDKLLTKI